MGTKRTHANASCTGANIGVHNLAGFVEHLHLFLRVIIFRHLVDLRNDVVGELMREFGNMSRRTRFDDVLVLLLQLFHGNGTGAACALVRRNVDLLDLRNLVDRIQNDNHHDGRAVRVCDDALTAEFRFVKLDVFRIHFRNDERNVRIHAVEASVVDADSTGLHCGRKEFLGNGGSCGGEHDVHTLEGIVSEFFNSQFFTAELDLTASATLGCEKLQRIQLEVAFFKDGEEFLSYCACGTDYCNITTHNLPLIFFCELRRVKLFDDDVSECRFV